MRGFSRWKVYLVCQVCALAKQNARSTHHILTLQSLLRSRSMCTQSPLKPLVGVVQMTTTSDKDANFQQGKSLIEKAVTRGAQMVFLPECFDYVADNREQAVEMAETVHGGTVERYRTLARDRNVWLSLGGLHEKAEQSASGRVYNTHLIIDNSGEIKGKYSKTHLFDVDIKGGVRLKETDFTIPGETVGPPVDTPVGNIGMAICYDLRFAELSLALRQQGAHILTFPSAFTVPTGMAHWETLLRARAVETQSYVIAAAQVGRHNAKRASYGHAMVVDPWGCVVCETHDKVDVCVTEIDLDYLNRRRVEMPVETHRRPDLYGSIVINSNVPIDERESYTFGQVSVPSSAVFHRSGLSFAFVNRKPVLPGHVLISPLRSVHRFRDLSPPEVADLWQVAQKVSKVVEAEHRCDSVTFSIQDGEDAGQTIKHVHIHILPRKPGDFQANDDVYKHLEDHDKNVKASAWRTDDDMAQEAGILRKYFTVTGS